MVASKTDFGRRCLRAFWTVALLVGMGLAHAPAHAGTRLALVMGNGDYAHASDLFHAVRDARDIATRFRHMGIEVHDGYDLTLSEMRQLVAGFRSRVRQDDAAEVLLYYAGHGFSLNGADHVVPVDASLVDRQTATAEAPSLEAILDDIRPGGDRNVVVLFDACRDSPLPMRPAAGEKSAGLTGRRPGVLISYATEFGRPTRDGKGTHSPYTRALLGALGTKPMSIEALLAKIRRSVRGETNGQQLPVVQGALSGPFEFGGLDSQARPSDRPGS